MWIFGYGSLIWRPGFAFAERRIGSIEGWSRRFWQRSSDHRGVPEAPGRVVTLTKTGAGRCDGIAYRIDPRQAARTLDELDVREQQGYRRLEVAVRLRGGGSVDALTYVATSENPDYVQDTPLSEIVEIVAAARGPSGPNDAYVFELARALREMGSADSHVFELERLIRREAAGPPAASVLDPRWRSRRSRRTR